MGEHTINEMQMEPINGKTLASNQWVLSEKNEFLKVPFTFTASFVRHIA